MVWSRPEGPPRVWDTIEIVKPNGEKSKFTIQEIPEDRYDEVLDGPMCNDYIRDEVISKSLNVIEDPECIKLFRDFWKKEISKGISIAAFEENGSDKPPIAAFNVLTVSDKESGGKITPIHSSMTLHEKIFTYAINCNAEGNTCARYGVDYCLWGLGLGTNRHYRRLGLGHRLLETRHKIGKYYNVKVTSTIFSSKVSQGAAAKAGFYTQIERPYDEIVDENGDMVFPNLKGKKWKLMEKVLF